MYGSRATVLSLAAFFVSAVPPGRAPADALRVLAVQTIPGKSHWNFMRGVLAALTDGGHDVTAFTPFPDGDRVNYTEVDTSGDLQRTDRRLDAEGVFETFAKTASMLSFMTSASRDFCDVAYRRREMRRILVGGGRGRYDVVLTEMGASDCVSYAARRLDVPLIYLIPSPMITFVERDLLGDVPNPATVSHVMAGHAVPRTFAQRLGNLVLSAYSAFAVKANGMALKNSRPSPYDRTVPVLPSVVFVNSHHVTDASRPTTPSVVPVGGIHLRTPESVPDVSIPRVSPDRHVPMTGTV